MTTTLLILLLVALSLACWLSTLKVSLDEASRSRIERQLSGGNDEVSVDLSWLFDHQDAIGGSVSGASKKLLILKNADMMDFNFR